MLLTKANIKILDAINMNADDTSDPVELRGTSLYSIQCYWTGFSATAASVVTEGSNQLDGTYTQIDAFTPTGTSGSRMLNVEQAGYAYIRVAYTQTDGAGVLTAHYNGKIQQS